MVWKRFSALRDRLLENKTFLKQVAESSVKDKKHILNGATITQLEIIRDLIQKVYLKKKISIPKIVFQQHKKALNYLVLKLKGQKVVKRKELQKILGHSYIVLPHLVKLILADG